MYWLLTFVNLFFIKRKHRIVIFGRDALNENAETLIRHIYQNGYEAYKFYCLFKDDRYIRKFAKKNIKIVRNPILTLYYLFTSRIIFHNYGLYRCAFRSCRKQKIFDVWHGCAALGKDVSYLSKILSKTDDYFLSTSDKLYPIIQYNFGLKPENLAILGNPRCDDLFSNRALDEVLTMPHCHFKIGFLPTFRKSDSLSRSDSNIDFPLLNEKNILDLNSFLSKNDVLLIIKPHPAQRDIPLFHTKCSNIRIYKNAFLRDRDVPLYEILGKMDALITDYSTVFHDYAILDRPIGFVMDDVEEYEKSLGLLQINQNGDLELNPKELRCIGPKIKTIEEFKQFISKVINHIDEYANDRKYYNQLFNTYCDNNNCKRLLNFMQIVL